MKGARVVVWDPLGQSHKTTKVGWMAEVTESRADLCPATYFKAWWDPLNKIHKI